MAWSNPESFRQAQAEAIRRLQEARREFVAGVAPKLDESKQRELFEKVMADPAQFDRVVKKYGIEGVVRWQNAMSSR